MARRSVTMADVAERAGVSQSTVSYVLNQSKTQIRISQETRERVLQAAQELDYHPHPAARVLRGKSTHLLGLILREIDDMFFAQLVEVVRDAAKTRGYDLILSYARSDLKEAVAITETLDVRQCDGFLLLGDLKESEADLDTLVRLWKEHHVVSVCRGSEILVQHSPSISIDNRKGVVMALDYLVQLGHRRIAFLDADREMGDLWERSDAYVRYMRARFGDLDPGYLRSTENTYAGGYRATRELVSLPLPPTAIVAADDTMAVGALRGATEAGYDVPGDISLIGFDDIALDAYLTPSLTTIHQPIEEIGQKAVELLLHLISEDVLAATGPHVVTEPELVIRESCAPPP
jgi:LacI family repressor for deo operon, udp, cdd, tsx, nupC, and nupG